MLPVKDASPDVQKAIREIWTVLTPLIARNKSLGGRRITNAGDSISPTDYVTRFELDKDLNGVGVQIRAISLDSPSVPTALTLAKGVRVGAFALRGSPITHAHEIFIASDQDYLGWVSDGAAWHYSFGVLRDTLANRPSTFTTNDVGLEFVATDTFEVFYWSGTAWVEVVLPLLVQIGGTTDSFPAIGRSGTDLVIQKGAGGAGAGIDMNTGLITNIGTAGTDFAANGVLTLDGSAAKVNIVGSTATGVFQSTGGAIQVLGSTGATVVDVGLSANLVRHTATAIFPITAPIALGATGAVQSIKQLFIDATNTAPGTTGNQTINKASGRVNIAAGGTTVTVTNSLVTAASQVFAVAVTADLTAAVTSVVPAAGSFVINTVAVTNETAFAFFVLNN